ncbi:MAG: SDR family oxidoreductase [Isosphaeraceae bacterium]
MGLRHARCSSTGSLSNATGYFVLARLVRDHAVGRGAPASVIMLGSMYGMVGSYPDAYEGLCPASPVAYHVLKGGILQMTRHLAVYWAADGVRVNSLSPGPFPSDRAPPAWPSGSKMLPLGRMGRPHESKGAVVFLASDASRFTTGQNLVIDGGGRHGKHSAGPRHRPDPVPVEDREHEK